MKTTYAGIIQRFHHWLGHVSLRALGKTLGEIERAGRGYGGVEHSERSVLCRKLNHLKIHSARTESPKIEGIRRRGFGFVNDVGGRSGLLVRPVTVRAFESAPNIEVGR